MKETRNSKQIEAPRSRAARSELAKHFQMLKETMANKVSKI